MSAESELVIVEESSVPTKDSPEVKERFRVTKIAVTWFRSSWGFMNFDRENDKSKILQKQGLSVYFDGARSPPIENTIIQFLKILEESFDVTWITLIFLGI